jgi:hypothetical protein
MSLLINILSSYGSTSMLLLKGYPNIHAYFEEITSAFIFLKFNFNFELSRVELLLS